MQNPLLTKILILKSSFLRVVTNTQETLEDAPNCGELGLEESTTRQAGESSIDVRDDFLCLLDCEWKPNPWFKRIITISTQWNDGQAHIHNTFRIMITSPQLPVDLNCLDDCFDRYLPYPQNQPNRPRNSPFLEDIRKNCSANGFDRQVPTHTKAAADFTASSFTNMDLFWSNRIASWNPNLDCLLYTKRTRRTNAADVGNFVSESPFTDDRVDQDDPRGYRSRSYARQQVEEAPDYYNTIIRASDPVETAIEICAMAKYIDGPQTSPYFDYTYDYDFNSNSNETGDINELQLFSPATCDNFLPNIYASFCQCVGTCAEPGPSPSNLIRSFFGDSVDHNKPGLWGCQQACQENDACQFWTLSRVKDQDDNFFTSSGAPDIHQCNLWKTCRKFRIPADSTDYDTATQYVSSDNWSGPEKCQNFKQCPLLENGSSGYEVSKGSTKNMERFDDSKRKHHQ